jgi:hypothetical protein
VGDYALAAENLITESLADDDVAMGRRSVHGSGEPGSWQYLALHPLQGLQVVQCPDQLHSRHVGGAARLAQEPNAANSATLALMQQLLPGREHRGDDDCRPRGARPAPEPGAGAGRPAFPGRYWPHRAGYRLACLNLLNF